MNIGDEGTFKDHYLATAKCKIAHITYAGSTSPQYVMIEFLEDAYDKGGIVAYFRTGQLRLPIAIFNQCFTPTPQPSTFQLQWKAIDLSQFDKPTVTMPKPRTCECGKDTHGFASHSTWCDLYER